MNNIRMIVTDLDRTLLRKDKSISDYSRAIINTCHQNGIMLVFATARPERAISQLQMNPLLSYVIANNGATVISGTECIQNIIIPENIKHSLIARFLADSRIKSMTVEAGGFLYTNDKEHSFWSLEADWNAVVTDFSTPKKESAPKISVECDDPEIVLNITRDYPEVCLLPNTGEAWSQIMHRDASKFNAVSFIANLAGVAIEDIISFGDDYNDVEMLQKCGVGVAVENAVADAKLAADFICGSNDNDGVAKFLENHVLCVE